MKFHTHFDSLQIHHTEKKKTYRKCPILRMKKKLPHTNNNKNHSPIFTGGMCIAATHNKFINRHTHAHTHTQIELDANPRTIRSLCICIHIFVLIVDHRYSKHCQFHYFAYNIFVVFFSFRYLFYFKPLRVTLFKSNVHKLQINI